MRKVTGMLLLIGLAALVARGGGIVTKAVEKLFPGAMITRLDVEDEGLFIRGRKSDGLGFELTMSASGEAREVCEQIDVNKVPGEIVKAIRGRVKDGRLLTAWKNTGTNEESKKEVLYRLVVWVGGKYLAAVARIDGEEREVRGHVTAVVALSDLPKAVAAAAKKHLRPIEIGRGGDDGTRSVCKTIELAGGEDEAAATMYWWHLEAPRRHYVITGDGKTVLVRQPIEPKELPKAVRDAVKKGYPKAKVMEVEKLTENGRTVYRIETETGDDEGLALIATPDGEITVDKEEEEEEEEE